MLYVYDKYKVNKYLFMLVQLLYKKFKIAICIFCQSRSGKKNTSFSEMQSDKKLHHIWRKRFTSLTCSTKHKLLFISFSVFFHVR